MSGKGLDAAFGAKKDPGTVVPPAAETTAVPAQEASATAEAPAVETPAPSASDAVSHCALGYIPPKPIERVKGVENVPIRVAIIDAQVTKIDCHWSEELKAKIACFGNECCKLYGLKKQYFLIPVVEYTTDRDLVVVNGDFLIKYFRLGFKDYSKLATLAKQVGDLTKVDLQATCDSTKFNTFDFADFRNEVATWRQYEEFEAAVLAKYESVKNLIVPLECQILPRQEFIERLRGVQGAAAAGDVSGAPSGTGLNLNNMIKTGTSQ